MFKKEMKNVTYKHEVDSMHKNRKPLGDDLGSKLNTSLAESVALNNKGALACEYNVGKRPESKSIQGLK